MSRVYGRWSGNPLGYKERPEDCIETVGGNTLWGPANAHQCTRKRGHGPDGLYCKQHAARMEREKGGQ